MGDSGTIPVNGHINGVKDASPKTIPVAIVGMGCRFGGGVTSPEKLWDLVAEARSAWSEIPPARYNKDAFYHPDAQKLGTTPVKGGYFLEEDVGLFDPSFFNFTAEVAASMDPQIRLQLEVTYEALESAGISLSQIAGSNTSVFAGSFIHDYHDLLTRDPLTLPRFFTTGNFTAMMANRISHFFDLRGPSTPVDTGCSTSITALHLACQTLRTGEADCAIVGGTCVMLNPDMFAQLSSLGFIGPDGKSFAFDHRAQGYGRGEGIAALVLKRLDEAIRDGDPIRAIIRETGMNQDGKTPTITSPSGEAQETLMRACYTRAGLDPLDTTYVEAHGTGTKTGDPIETAAIGSVFARDRSPDYPLFMGSVKSNLGHTEAASGLAAVIKTVKMLENRQIPPSINLEKVNDSVNLRGGTLKIPQTLTPWGVNSGIRRASVNNFGYGGSNTHVIMEEATTSRERRDVPTQSSTRLDDSSYVFLLSAKDEGAVKRMRSNLEAYLESASATGKETTLRDLAYTLCQRRSRFSWTTSFSAESLPELCECLADPSRAPIYAAAAPRLGFVFTGQGAQWHAMGRELMNQYPVFMRALQEADTIFHEFGAAWSCIEELTRAESETLVNKPLYSFPLSCVVQLALVRLLESWEVLPTAVTGHSSGEVAAAFAASALTFREALAIVYFRGLLTSHYIQKATVQGGMLAVGLGSEAVQPYLGRLTAGLVTVACVNSPASVTVSGDLSAIEELQQLLEADNVFARRLKVESAYHSHHMLPLQKDYHDALSKHLRQSRTFKNVIFSSPVSGDIVTNAEDLGPQHWVENMLQPVLFQQSLRNMVSSTASTADAIRQVDMIVEIGPHGALAGPIRQCLAEPDLKALSIGYASCLSRGNDAVRTMQSLAATLLSNGYSVNLGNVNFPDGCSDLHTIPDLPSYPWNHSQRFWSEPRVSREHRFRQHAQHELLGTRVPGLASNLAVWRLLIRPADISWVRDHVVQTDLVYPGAGCLAMAIEGMRQISLEAQHTVRGYRLREIEITRALVIPDTSNPVEVQLVLKAPDGNSLLSNWREFRISSATIDGEWAEHCHGLVGVEIESQSPAKGSSHLLSTNQIEFDTTAGAYFRSMEPAHVFRTLREAGIEHGPLFRHLNSIQAGSQKAVVAFASPNNAVIGSDGQHVIHPITLDSIFQGAYGTLSVDDQREVGAAIPRSVREMYVSASISRESGHGFRNFAILNNCDSRGFSVSMAVVQDDLIASSDPVPVLEIQEMQYQSLGPSSLPGSDSQHGPYPLCLTTEWKEHFDLSDKGHLVKELEYIIDPNDKLVESELTRAAYHFVHDTLASLTKEDIASLGSHHQGLLAWMHQLEIKAARDELAPRSSRWAGAREGIKEMLFDRVASQSVNGELLCRVGHELGSILRGEVSATDLVKERDLLHRYFEGMLYLQPAVSQAVRLIQLLSHQNPRANILEIGGRTGAFTEPILQALGSHQPGAAPRVRLYTFTDISLDACTAARDRFSSWGDLIRCEQLNIEMGPEEQGFKAGSYDIIIASLAFHTAKDIYAALKHARQLLKDGGKLIVLEKTRNSVDTTLILGALQGWWPDTGSEPALSSNLSSSVWDSVFRQSSFTGIDLKLPACDDEKHQAISVIVSTADNADADAVSIDRPIAVVYADQEPTAEWVGALEAALGGRSVTLSSLHTVDPRDKVALFVPEISAAFLANMNEEDFASLKRILMKAKGVMWVTRGSALHCDVPEHALHAGLLRTCRLEDSSKRYISLDLDPVSEPWALSSVKVIADVLRTTFHQETESSSVDWEYAQRGNSVLIPRVRYDVPESEGVAPSHEPSAELEPFHQPGRHLRLYVQTPGLLDSLVFMDDLAAEEALPEDFVEIEPQAFGLNFRDVMVAMGQLEEPQMGFECAGLVTEVRGAAADHFQVGDRVCAFTGHGHFATRTRVHWTSVAKIPEQMTFETAATIPMVFATAYYCLFEIARLEEGETVLIHAASGGVGQAAIILAQWRKATIFVTVGTPGKREFLIKTYGIREDHIFSSRDTSFSSMVKSATGGRGVDVVLNSLAGELMHETWNCLAHYGRFVEIGKKDIQLNKRLEMRPFKDAVGFTSFDLVHLGDYRGPALSRVLRTVVDLLDAEAIRTITPITIYPISEIGRAFRQMQAGKHIGKIVLTPQLGDRVKIITKPKPVRLPSNASYLIIGGLGGIGRSISKRLVQRGAKHLVLLSRSAASHPESHALVSELQGAGCHAVVRNCDVSNVTHLTQVLSECQETMPPIRGVIQAAMNIQDSILEHMTFQQWHGGISAKVDATRNLHEHFGTALEFFIMLSSVVGVVGNASQTNYGAGGSYQDALAHHRAAQGLPAVSIDLGMVNSVGFVAENKNIADRLRREGYRPLEEEEVLQLVEAAIRKPQRSVLASQIITGIAGADASKANEGWRQDVRFADLQLHQGAGSLPGHGQQSRQSLRASIGQAAEEEVPRLISQAIIGKLSSMFTISESEIDAMMPLSRYGVDSLVAVELRNWLVAQTGCEMSIFDVLGSSSLWELAEKISQRIQKSV
ncbi:polyketide synthase [Aspergillus desertorum]